MAKVSLCLFIVAALLGGIAADLMCILKETIIITPDHFITNPDRACRGLDTKFDKTRREFKNCLGFDVDINALEALHQEFCEINSEFRKKVDRNRHCIAGNLAKSMNCLSSMDNSPHLENENIHGKSMFQICQSLSVEMSNCLADKVGGPCGDEGLEVYRRMAKVSEPFFTASCFSVAKMAAGDDDDMAEEIEYAENKVVEASLARNFEDEVSAAISYSPFVWCILVGLLFVLKWW